MSWNTFHRRGEILRAVVDTADDRRDGALPMDVPGVAESFTDELDLIGALQLKWSARLAVNIERHLHHEPADLESAVTTAWCATAEQLPGVRAVIDHHREHPRDARMDRALRRARQRERAHLAAAAGQSAQAGTRVETLARQCLQTRAQTRPEPRAETRPETRTPAQAEGAPPAGASFADRLRAAVAA